MNLELLWLAKEKYTIRHRHPAVLQMVGCEAGLRACKF